MSAQHTPGPWSLEVAEITQTGDLFCAIDGVDSAGVVYATLRDRDELLANARLIAAAPELLEADEKLTSAFACHGRDELPDYLVEGVEALWAAIAKARGEQA